MTGILRLYLYLESGVEYISARLVRSNYNAKEGLSEVYATECGSVDRSSLIGLYMICRGTPTVMLARASTRTQKSKRLAPSSDLAEALWIASILVAKLVGPASKVNSARGELSCPAPSG